MRSDYSGRTLALLAGARAMRDAYQYQDLSPRDDRPVPFVTISRQAGAGGRTFARMLVERLNEFDGRKSAWKCWDQALVDKVVQEHHLRAAQVEALERDPPTWLEDFLKGLTIHDQSDAPDAKTFRCVATAIRSLAAGGRAVIVGRGGGSLTSDMPGGVHLRLVAPLEYRVRQMAAEMVGSRGDGQTVEAATRVMELDRNRQAFHQFHWPERPLLPEFFTATLNTGAAEMSILVDSVLPMVEGARRSRVAATSTMRRAYG